MNQFSNKIGKFIKGKTAVFIDAANIFYSQRTLGWRIDYEKLAVYLRKETDLDGMYYYTGVIKQKEGQRAFLEKLESFGYTVTAKLVMRAKYIDLPKLRGIIEGDQKFKEPDKPAPEVR